MSCNSSSNPFREKTTIELLQGSWKACNSTSTNSLMVRFIFNNDQITETVSEWDQPFCVGIETVGLNFVATVDAGEVGESIYVNGATDITITPTSDLFGCGVNQPAYTLIKFFDKNYTKFNPGTGTPTCNPSLRTTSIEAGLTFIKQ